MYRRGIGGTLLALLVVTTGCLGGALPAVPDAAGTGTPDASGGAGGGTDGTAGGDAQLVDNRTAALQEAGSYTTTWGMAVTEDGTVVGKTEYVTMVDYESRQYYFESRVTSEGEVRTAMAFFHADGTTYQRFGSGEDATYAAKELDFTPQRQYAAQTYVRDASDLEEFERKGTETFDGVTVTRYVRTENPAWLGGQAGSDAEVTWTDFTFEVLVDGQGLVRLQRWHAEGVDGEGVKHTVEYSYELTGVGSTTIEEPVWTDEAPTPAGS